MLRWRWIKPLFCFAKNYRLHSTLLSGPITLDEVQDALSVVMKGRLEQISNKIDSTKRVLSAEEHRAIELLMNTVAASPSQFSVPVLPLANSLVQLCSEIDPQSRRTCFNLLDLVLQQLSLADIMDAMEKETRPQRWTIAALSLRKRLNAVNYTVGEAARLVVLLKTTNWRVVWERSFPHDTRLNMSWAHKVLPLTNWSELSNVIKYIEVLQGTQSRSWLSVGGTDLPPLCDAILSAAQAYSQQQSSCNGTLMPVEVALDVMTLLSSSSFWINHHAMDNAMVSGTDASTDNDQSLAVERESRSQTLVSLASTNVDFLANVIERSYQESPSAMLALRLAQNPIVGSRLFRRGFAQRGPFSISASAAHRLCCSPNIAVLCQPLQLAFLQQILLELGFGPFAFALDCAHVHLSASVLECTFEFALDYLVSNSPFAASSTNVLQRFDVAQVPLLILARSLISFFEDHHVEHFSWHVLERFCAVLDCAANREKECESGRTDHLVGLRLNALVLKGVCTLRRSGYLLRGRSSCIRKLFPLAPELIDAVKRLSDECEEFDDDFAIVLLKFHRQRRLSRTISWLLLSTFEKYPLLGSRYFHGAFSSCVAKCVDAVAPYFHSQRVLTSRLTGAVLARGRHFGFGQPADCCQVLSFIVSADAISPQNLLPLLEWALPRFSFSPLADDESGGLEFFCALLRTLSRADLSMHRRLAEKVVDESINLMLDQSDHLMSRSFVQLFLATSTCASHQQLKRLSTLFHPAFAPRIPLRTLNILFSRTCRELHVEPLVERLLRASLRQVTHSPSPPSLSALMNLASMLVRAEMNWASLPSVVAESLKQQDPSFVLDAAMMHPGNFASLLRKCRDDGCPMEDFVVTRFTEAFAARVRNAQDSGFASPSNFKTFVHLCACAPVGPLTQIMEVLVSTRFKNADLESCVLAITVYCEKQPVPDGNVVLALANRVALCVVHTTRSPETLLMLLWCVARCGKAAEFTVRERLLERVYDGLEYGSPAAGCGNSRVVRYLYKVCDLLGEDLSGELWQFVHPGL